MEGNPVSAVPAGNALTVSGPRPSGTVPASPTAETALPAATGLPAGTARALRTAAVVAVAVTALGLLLDTSRTAAAILVSAQFILGIGLGGLLFVAFGYVLQAGWQIVIRRVPEAMAGILPVGAVATFVAVACVGALYEWSHASHVEGDPILEGKAAWLNTGFFFVRSLVYLALWLGFAWAIRRNSLQQDVDGEESHTRRNLKLSALFLVVFAVTFTLACVDWIMSMEPHWYSTVFAIYNFSGLFTSALATILLVVIALKRMGRLPELRDDHLHDLGKLTLSFATFWAYIWFCQYMLIWYSHIPEETIWYAHRQVGGWSVVHIANPIIGWMIPFLILLPRPAKRNPKTLVRVAVLLLFARWFDLYYQVNPVVMPDGPELGLWELAPMVAVVSIGILALFRILQRHPLVPRKDPYLVESLHHHV